MTALSYTSGNPSNLVAGGNASMADIQGPFTDIRTFVNGGSLDETNVPNLAAAFTTYKPGLTCAVRTRISSAAAAGTYVMLLDNGGLNVTVGGANATGVEDVLIPIDPTRFNANSRTTKLNLRLQVIPNAVAPAITFTAGLYPIATVSGASGAQPLLATVGTVIAGSTAAVASPGALSVTTTVSSGDFNCPAVGPYAICVVTSGTPAAGSINALIAEIDVRQV